MTEPVLQLQHGARTLPGGQRVLHEVELTVGRGESVAIIGRSGSGKSTLLAGLGLVAPFDRETDYRLAGAEVRTLSERKAARLRARTIGFVLQNSVSCHTCRRWRMCGCLCCTPASSRSPGPRGSPGVRSISWG